MSYSPFLVREEKNPGWYFLIKNTETDREREKKLSLCLISMLKGLRKRNGLISDLFDIISAKFNWNRLWNDSKDNLPSFNEATEHWERQTDTQRYIDSVV